jgi:hypothetical protein
MGRESLTIDKEQVGRLILRLKKGNNLDSAIDEVRRMIDIKSTEAGKFDSASCCGGSGGIDNCLWGEVFVLEHTLTVLKGGDVAKGTELLEKYAHMIV